MKSCRNCRHYRSRIRHCTKKDLHIIDCLSGDKCSAYKEKRDLKNATAMCSKCRNLNKYSYCWKKKRCFSEEEQNEKRKCIHFKRYKRRKK